MFIIPILSVVSISLTDESVLESVGYSLIPKEISTLAYTYIFANPQQIIDGYAVTILVSAVGTVLSLLVTTSVAYALSRDTFVYRKGITYYLFFTMLFSGGLVPSYILNTQYLGLGNSIWVYIIPSILNAWNIVVVRTFMQGIPSALVESAKIDVASEYCIYWRIILPLSKPVIATIGLLTLLGKWNMWQESMLYIRNTRLYTLQYLLQRMLLDAQFAQQMSNMGYTYDQILGFYYEGCERIQYTFTHTILPSIGAGDSPVVSTEAPATIAPDAGADARIQLVGVNDSIAIRYTPSASGKTLIAAVNGSSVKVVSYGSEWTLIRYGEICGYVPTSSLFFVTMPPTDPSASATNVVQWGTVKGSSSLNMRDEGSYDGSVIGSIPVGEHVAILKYGTWSRVQYGQQVGYCLTSYLTISSAYPGNLASSSDSAMVSLPDNTGTTPLFATASTSGTILLHIPHGTQVTVHSNDGSWSRVTVSGVTGYVLSVALDFAATGTTPTEPPLAEGEMYAIVASDASTLNLRNGPSTTYDIITEIPRGTQIVVTSYGTDWCAVRWGSLTGYVMTKYLSFDVDTPTPTPTVPPAATNVPAGAPALTVTNTDLYTSSSATSEIQLVIPDGETVSVVEYGNTWTQIAYGGLTGYVYTSTLQLYQDMPNDTPTASPTPTPTPTATAVPTYAPANASATLLLNAQLREEPDSSSTLLGTIPAGAQVKVTAIGTSWSQVVYNGATGWVLTSQLLIEEKEATPTPTATAQPTAEPTEIISDESDSTREGVTAWVVTTVTSVNLRADASMEGAILASLPGGTCIVVLEEGATWSLVRYGSKTGYVFSQYIMYTEPHEALGILYVNTAIDPLALRNKPTTSSTVLLRIPRGSTVTLLEKQGDWCYVQYGQTIGYCASRYLSTEKPEAHVSDDTRLLDATLAAVEGWEAIVNEGGTESIFLRAWCSVEAPDVAEIQPDKRVTVIQKGNVWCLISYEGNEGYCLTGQLHLIPPAE